MKRFEGLQFITNGTAEESLRQAEEFLAGGGQWVQLRMKDSSEEEVEAVARKMKTMTDAAEAVLVIDDHVEVCKRVGASGVHLGKNDMDPARAREILGEDFIIGGTCNTFADVLRVKDSVDYIGCGPFRFTTTKKNLAPVLGLEGYRELIWQMRSEGINTPVVAIGGITVGDIRDVLDSGPNGIALSGEIINSGSISAKTSEVLEVLSGPSRSGWKKLK